MKKNLVAVITALSVGIIFFAGCKKDSSETGKAELTSSSTSESALLGLSLSDTEEETMNVNFITKLVTGLPETSLPIEKVISNVEAYSNYRFSKEDIPVGATAIDVVTIPVTGGKLLDGVTVQALAKQIFQSASEATKRVRTLKGATATVAVDVNLVKTTATTGGLTTYELKVTSVVGEVNTTVTRGVCPDYNPAIGYTFYDLQGTYCGGTSDGSTREMMYRLNNYDCGHMEGLRNNPYMQSQVAYGSYQGGMFYYSSDQNPNPFNSCLNYTQMVQYTQACDTRARNSLKSNTFGSAASQWHVRAYQLQAMSLLCGTCPEEHFHTLSVTYKKKLGLVSASILKQLRLP